MKHIIIVTFLATLILQINAQSYLAQDQENEMKEKSQNEITEYQGGNVNKGDNNGEIIYQCQVNLEVLSNIPGQCSKCGLTLKGYTVEEVINNLNEDGHKKPELKIKMITRVEVEEDTLTEEIVDTTAFDENMPQIEFSEFDHFNDGTVYQCPNCPEEVWNEELMCPICGEYYISLTIDEARANLERKYRTKKADEKKIKVSSSQK